jgi:hypothetical protein
MPILKAIDEGGELSILLEKVGEGPPGVEELGQLVQWTRRWLGLKVILEKGNMTFKDLKGLLLGLTQDAEKKPENDAEGEPDGEDESEPEPDEEGEKPKRKGHGRRAAKDYRGCRRVHISPDGLKPGDECPECVGTRKGRLRHHKPHRPLTRLRLSGGAPITGTVYVGHPLCCSKCGVQFRPDWPQDANRETYDASAKAMIALMRHWYGFPSYRLEKLQKELGIPVPDGTQSDLIKASVEVMEPVFHALFRRAALARMFILDDTSTRIQTVTSERKKYPNQKRHGAHVTGIIARDDERDIYLYRVGTQHAGENMEDLLCHRPKAMPPPLQMSDALAANTAHPFDTIVAYCLNHARGNFVDVEDSFPVECQKVLKIFSEVFKNETETKRRQMNHDERLLYHQRHSAEPMAALFAYLHQLLDRKLIEPASGMGKAAKYMLKREAELTRFLEIPGAPLDSNAIERGLKHAVLIRKNSLFYLNEMTAYNAGVLMTLAATCVHNQEDPLHYFTALLDNQDKVKANPEGWFPWRYRRDQSPRDG